VKVAHLNILKAIDLKFVSLDKNLFLLILQKVALHLVILLSQFALFTNNKTKVCVLQNS
jgi:hypothetical protein